MAVTPDHVWAFALGLVFTPVGVLLRRLGRSFASTVGPESSMHLYWRIQGFSMQFFGTMLAVLGPVMAIGAVVGSIVWGDHGEPRWPL